MTTKPSQPEDFGIIPLVSPDPSDIDIVFIHGLDGHRVQSCTTESGKMWLCDFLPWDLPHARILTYGYDGYTKDRNQFSNETLRGHATGLLSRLAMNRRGIEDRPIIFVAHNVGGIILKSALIAGYSCHKDHLYSYRQVYDATIGIIYLGTPHQGTPHNYLDIVLNESGRNDKLAKHLTENSEWLQRQLTQDLPILAGRKITIKYFYENRGTIATGGKRLSPLVDKASAIVAGAVNTEQIGLERNHAMLTKFESRDEDYYLIAAALQIMSGSKTIQSSRASEDRSLL
ncbi:hypothetical protein BU17DRAFT_82378 [Hysterangium stoloniferum]|nr:hypothetical protein BU17DRAFT_82378 [Hysterangium stoloniferum]